MTCGGIPAIPFVMIKIIWIAFLGAVLKWQPLFYVRELLGGKKTHGSAADTAWSYV